MARRSNRQTTEEQFVTIKTLTKAGRTAEEIANYMNIGTSRVFCCRRFETYEDFKAGRHDVYESWSNDGRKTHKKSEPKEKEPAGMEQNVHDIARELRIIRSVMISMADALGVNLKLEL